MVNPEAKGQTQVRIAGVTPIPCLAKLFGGARLPSVVADTAVGQSAQIPWKAPRSQAVRVLSGGLGQGRAGDGCRADGGCEQLLKKCNRK